MAYIALKKVWPQYKIDRSCRICCGNRLMVKSLITDELVPIPRVAGMRQHKFT